MIVIPVHDMILFPGVHFYFKKEAYQQWSGKQEVTQEEILFLLQREATDVKEAVQESFYPIGFLAQTSGVDAEGLVQVDIRARVDVTDIENDGGTLRASASVRPDTDDMPKEERKELLERLRGEILQFIRGFQWGVFVRSTVQRWSSLEEMICAVSGYMNLSWEEKYALMETDSLRERSRLIEQAVYAFMEESRVAQEAQEAQQESHDQAYREAAIRKQLGFLQKQLEDMHPETISETEQLEERIRQSGMNETAEKEARKVLNRMKQEGREGHEYGMLYDYLDFVTGLIWKKEEPSAIDLDQAQRRKVLNRMKQEGREGHEYGMLYDYLDFVTGLIWKKEEPSAIDLDQAQRILDEDHYGLKMVKERIIEQLAVMALNKKQSGSILLLVGAPGTGKTSIGQSIAKALGRSYVRISLGGIRDEAEIRGHRRTYIGAMPGRIMEGIRRNAGAHYGRNEAERSVQSRHGA